MSADQQFWWNWWLNFGLVVAALATICVALFGEWIRARLFSPRLELRLLHEYGEKQNVPLEWMNQDGTTGSRMGLAPYYHLKVSNASHWPRATNVQVFLTRVEEPGPDGDLTTTWTGDIPLQWRNQNLYPPERTIGPAFDCDLCNVVEDKWVEIRPLIFPNNLVTRRKEATNIVLTLQARANEGESAIKRFQIAWDKKWEAGDMEMAKHLVVKEYTC